ncbi:MAG TPA: DUF1287 domain-containing protein [Fimbriimonas sp.]
MIPLLLLAALPPNLVEGARQQLAWGTRYDPTYVRIAYPNGDVPRSQGVCTDVIVRAYRHTGIDLQKLIHEDIRRSPASYPRVKKRDRNIDHRRVPNQVAFFRRHGAALSNHGNWRPGDIVAWKLPNGRDHIGVLSDRLNGRKLPYVVHNIGPAPAEEDVLTAWTITGHFRYPAPLTLRT